MLRSVLAVLAGYLTIFVGVTTLFAFILFVGFGGMPEPDFRPPAWLLWVELATSPLIAALAGYVCAWIARRRPLQHAIALVAVIIVMGVVSAVTDAGEKPLWSSIALPVLAAGGVLLGARLRLVHVRVSALAVALLIGLVGCGQEPEQRRPDPDRKATAEECARAVDHILARPDAPTSLAAGREPMVRECARVSLAHDIDCAMATRTFTELSACPPPGSAKPD